MGRARRSRRRSTPSWPPASRTTTASRSTTTASAPAPASRSSRRTVDFGATDPPLKPDEDAAAKTEGDPVHVPTVLGAVTVSYNVAGIEKGLRLDGATIAAIFLGKIRKWNDPAIARSTGSSSRPTRTSRSATARTGRARRRTSRVLADYSPSGRAVRRRQDGQVADRHGRQGQRRRRRCVKQNDGSVGYVEQAYALQNNFTTAR